MRQFIVCIINLDLRAKVVFISAIFGAALGMVGVLRVGPGKINILSQILGPRRRALKGSAQ